MIAPPVTKGCLAAFESNPSLLSVPPPSITSWVNGVSFIWFLRVLDQRLLLVCRAWFSLLAMLLRENIRRRDCGHGGKQLVFPTADDIALAFHHGFESNFRYVGGIIFLGLSDFRVNHVRSFEEFGFGCARHEARHGHASVFQLTSERERERVDERLGPVVNGIESSGREAGD